jgi:hypothetical protein
MLKRIENARQEKIIQFAIKFLIVDQAGKLSVQESGKKFFAEVMTCKGGPVGFNAPSKDHESPPGPPNAL